MDNRTLTYECRKCGKTTKQDRSIVAVAHRCVKNGGKLTTMVVKGRKRGVPV